MDDSTLFPTSPGPPAPGLTVPGQIVTSAVDAFYGQRAPLTLDTVIRARCRSCDALVVWVTFRSGSRNPIDPDPQPGGNIVLASVSPAGEVRAVVLRDDDRPAHDEPRYVSHFTTCPQAAQWRGSRS